MLPRRYTALFIALAGSYAPSITAQEASTDNNDRMSILIKKGYSTPNVTTQTYSGNDVIKIEPQQSDINKSLDEIIAEHSPGFIHTNSGTSKHNSNNFYRGLSDKYTLYLLNGVPFPSTTTGSQNLPNIPVESIQRIEVIRGAQASLYGSSSLTGVINIITKTGADRDAKLNFSAGSHNTQRVAGMYADNIGNLQFMTSLDIDKSDGYKMIEDNEEDNFGYQTYSMNSYIAYVTETNRFSLAINNSTDNLDINSYNSTDWSSGKADSVQDTLQLTGKYIQKINANIYSEFTLSNADVDLKADEYNSSNVDHYATNETLTQLHFHGQWAKLAVNLGGEFTYSKYTSNNNGNNRKQAATYLAFSHDTTDWLNLSGGLRGDKYSDFGNAFTYSAGISAFDLIALNYKTSFTAPSYNDLYWPDVGNPDLEAEEGKMLELALTHNISTEHAYIPLKLSLYKGQLDNKIEWAAESEGSWIWRPYNIGKVDVKGVEAYFKYDAERFVYDLSAAYSRSLDESTGEQLNNVPKWSASSSIQYNITKTISPKLTYSYIGERSSSYTDLEESHILDFAITYQAFKHFNIGLNVNNLTDNDRQLYDGYNADGRTFEISIGANL